MTNTTTTKAAAFTKGQRVFFVRSLNRKGKFAVSPLTVYSCGAKRMVLVDDRGVKFAGHNFLPQREQYGDPRSTVETGMTLEEAVEFARQQATLFRVEEIERHRGSIAHWTADGYASPAYVAAMEREIAEIEADPIGVEVQP
jgi:hypothetical protein